jgi:L-malate glycosyltransferase
MHILLAGPCELAPLTPHLSRGVEALPTGMPGPPVRHLADALVGLGHQVTLVTLDQTVRRPIRAHGPRLQLLVYPARPSGRARDFFRRERRHVADAVSRVRPDVVHAHWTYEYALGALQAGLPTVVTVHDWAPAILRHHVHPFRAVRLLMQLETFRKRPHLTTVSPYMQDRIQRLVRQRVALIPNGIPDCVFKGAVTSSSTGNPRIIAVNQGWSAYKNVGTLLQAFQIVRGHVEGATLELVGSGYGPGEDAERWARERGLENDVTFVGALTNQAALMRIRSADVLAHPARTESFGMVLAEAMASRTAVLGGLGSGAVPWVLDHGRSGVLCNVADAEDMANGLLALLRNPVLRSQVQENGYNRASLHFRMSKVVQAYLRQYSLVAR